MANIDTSVQPFPVLLLGGDTGRNRGDRAIRAAIVAQISAWNPAARVLVVSRDPKRDEAEWGVCAAAGSLPELLRRRSLLRGLRLVVWGGGHLLQDDSSLVKNPYWAIALRRLRRRVRCPLVGYGLGFGPVTTAWGRVFAARAVAQLDALAVRDETSARLARTWSGRALAPRVIPDPAVDLSPADPAEARAFLEQDQRIPPRAGELRIGIGLRRWFHVGRRRILPLEWRYRLAGTRPPPPPAYRQLLEHLAGALNRFARHRDVRVLFFPMYCAPWEGDDAESRGLGARLDAPWHVIDLDVPSGLVKAAAGLCDLFIGVRLHSAILALGMNVPTLGIAYVGKTGDLFNQVGLPDQVLGISDAAAPGGEERILEMLTRLHANRDAVRAAQARAWHALQAKCHDGYLAFLREIPARAD